MFDTKSLMFDTKSLMFDTNLKIVKHGLFTRFIDIFLYKNTNV